MHLKRISISSRKRLFSCLAIICSIINAAARVQFPPPHAFIIAILKRPLPAQATGGTVSHPGIGAVSSLAGTCGLATGFTWMRKRELVSSHHDVGNVIPELRFLAGQYRSTPEAIDDLVELTLHAAVAELERRPADLPLSRWLQRIMKRIVLH